MERQSSGSQIIKVAAPVRDQATSALRLQIIDGHMEPGSRLIEREICEQLGISRGTVREALRQLEAEGLVTVIPGRGPVVASIDDEDIRGLYEVRIALESLAVGLFVDRATSQEVSDLQAAFDKLEEAHASGSTEAILSVKDGLYRVLYRGAQNTTLSDQATTLHARITRLRITSLGRPGRDAISLEEVRDLVSAIQSRDRSLAVQMCETHVRNAWRAVVTSPEGDSGGAEMEPGPSEGGRH